MERIIRLILVGTLKQQANKQATKADDFSYWHFGGKLHSVPIPNLPDILIFNSRVQGIFFMPHWSMEKKKSFWQATWFLCLFLKSFFTFFPSVWSLPLGSFMFLICSSMRIKHPLFLDSRNGWYCLMWADLETGLRIRTVSGIG